MIPQIGGKILDLLIDHYNRYGLDETQKTVPDVRREISVTIRRDFQNTIRAEQEIQDILDSLSTLTALGQEIDTIEHRHPSVDISKKEHRMDDLWGDIGSSLRHLVELTGLTVPWGEAA